MCLRLLSWISAAALLVAPMAMTPCPGQEPSRDDAPDAAPVETIETRALIEKVAALGQTEVTRLPPDYIYRRLWTRHDSEEIVAAFDAALAEGSTAALRDLVRALEQDFVHSPDTSSLDLLNPELSVHFTEFDWQENDYPGGAEGPNEQLADIMVDALDIVSPERRANRSRTAVVLRSEATEEVWQYLLAQWTPVPGEGDWKLNSHAVAAYIRMRDAAAEDGVDLTIQSGHRDPQVAKRNAERAGNPYAVASFSAHSLGLAIDFVLPRAGQEDDPFRLTTRPMAHVVAMRASPVHKWLHLHAHRYGWYPFQHEPWHWEYNPPGFREVFWGGFPAGMPQRAYDPDAWKKGPKGQRRRPCPARRSGIGGCP